VLKSELGLNPVNILLHCVVGKPKSGCIILPSICDDGIPGDGKVAAIFKSEGLGRLFEASSVVIVSCHLLQMVLVWYPCLLADCW
jgi:hypothetical protein